MPRRREHLPQQFDPVTNQTIELIDVLWLDGNAIVAAFEIESTTSIYSGLLRMSDLLARQPNISVPLFLVAPDERREKVIQQVNRPTFERMKPPLVEVAVTSPSRVCKNADPVSGVSRRSRSEATQSMTAAMEGENGCRQVAGHSSSIASALRPSAPGRGGGRRPEALTPWASRLPARTGTTAGRQASREIRLGP